MIIKSIKNALLQLYYKVKYWKKKGNYGSVYSSLNIDYKDEEQMAGIISKCLREKIPYCIGKIGGNEANAVVYDAIGSLPQKRKAYIRLCYYAGFFPKKFDADLLNEYVSEQISAIKQIDMLVYYEKEYEEYLLKKFASPQMIWVDVVGSWSQKICWTRELKGYRVVVVHPYARLIEQQYHSREKIYPNSDVLPQFDLRVVEAVQTMAESKESRFATWFDALEYMYKEIMKEDFDIALIGCGAYGLPLAARVKKAGKIGVHMGGDLQMLFGIRGKRWDNRELAQRWFNDYWVRPGDSEKVNGFESIENGCYW